MGRMAAGLAWRPAWAISQCPEQFAADAAPNITNVKLQSRTQEVCFESYAALHSPASAELPCIQQST